MQIGMFTAMQWSPEENPGTVLACLKEQVRTARNNGFKGLMVGQHVLTGPMGMFQLTPLLGALAEEAKGMQIGPGVLLLSMMNPSTGGGRSGHDRLAVRWELCALCWVGVSPGRIPGHGRRDAQPRWAACGRR